jgi:hypothetical protein
MARRNKMVLAGALLAVVMLANVSQALNTWTGADANAPADWFRAGNWDTGIVIPPMLPGALGYSYTITGANKVVDVLKRVADPNGDPNAPGAVLLQAGAMGLVMGNGAGDICTLNVMPGATLTIGSVGIESAYGDSLGGYSTGNINVYGTIDSQATNGVRLARRGDSTMTIYSGGKLLSPGNRVELQGGNGTLDVKVGGYVNTSELRLNNNCGENLYVARLNNTTGTVDCNGIINVTSSAGIGLGTATQGTNPTPRAVLNLKSGAITVGSSTTAGNIHFPSNLNSLKTIVNVNGGRLTVAGSVLRAAGTLNPAIDRQFNITGGQVNIRTWNDLAGNLTQAGGTFSPAIYIAATDSYNEVGMTYFGTAAVNYTQQAGATIQIDIAGSTQSTGGVAAGRYDFISSAGNISLAGPLMVIFRESYELYANNVSTYAVISAANISGGFSNLSGGKVNAYDASGNYQGQYTVTMNPTSVVLSNYSATNLPPIVTMSDIYTYLAVANSISIAPTVTDENIGTVAYVWSITAQPLGSNVTITPNTTTKDITVGVDMVGVYTLRLTATDGGGKIGVNSITINVAADACEAAKAKPGFIRLYGDVDNNCVVNMVDVGLMVSNWLHGNSL